MPYMDPMGTGKSENNHVFFFSSALKRWPTLVVELFHPIWKIWPSSEIGSFPQFFGGEKSTNISNHHLDNTWNIINFTSVKVGELSPRPYTLVASQSKGPWWTNSRGWLAIDPFLVLCFCWHVRAVCFRSWNFLKLLNWDSNHSYMHICIYA